MNMINRNFKSNWLKILNNNSNIQILDDPSKINEIVRIPLTPINIDAYLLYYLFEILYPKFVNDQQNILDMVISDDNREIISLYLYETQKTGIHQSYQKIANKVIIIQEGDLKIGDFTFRVIHTPGHTLGSVCLYWPEMKVLFTGDVVFRQGVGRTDLPGGKGEDLKASIRMLSELEVEHLLPGHGDVISGRDLVKANFSEIERVWFGYL